MWFLLQPLRLCTAALTGDGVEGRMARAFFKFLGLSVAYLMGAGLLTGLAREHGVDGDWLPIMLLVVGPGWLAGRLYRRWKRFSEAALGSLEQTVTVAAEPTDSAPREDWSHEQ